MRAHERIPLHDHSDRNAGGKIDGNASTAVVTSGSQSAGSAGVTAHSALTGLDADDHSQYLTTTSGEGHAVQTTSATGAAATLDCSIANIFDLTLTDDCTISIANPPAAGVGGRIIVILRQGGSGSYTVTWPAEVDWPDTDGTTGGAAPTLWTAVGAQDDVELATLDGGVTWGGTFSAHPPTAFALTVKDEGVALSTAATSLDFVGAGVVASGAGAAKTITIAGGSGTSQHILLADGHATPFTFNDLLQMDDGSDFMWSDA